MEENILSETGARSINRNEKVAICGYHLYDGI